MFKIYLERCEEVKDMLKKEYWYRMLKLQGIGTTKKRELIDYFGSPEEIFQSSVEKLKQSPLKYCRNAERIIHQILNGRVEEQIHREFLELERKQIYFISYEDEEYPKKLKQLYDYPCGLFVKGRLPSEERASVAIIGARNCSAYGKEMALYFSEELAKAGVDVISGMARGIDGYAHQGALAVNGFTYAVLGTGIDICYPRENIELYRKMEKQGGIISEFVPGEEALPFHFPMRNRIISGLSDGVLVIEAKEKSGSLITVDQALEQGKDIFVVPGRIGDRLSEGSNRLIKQGGILVTEPVDILNFYSEKIKFQYKEWKKINNVLDSKQKIVYASLSLMPKHLDEILNDTGLIMTQVIQILTQLELQGYIKQSTKNYYMISR